MLVYQDLGEHQCHLIQTGNHQPNSHWSISETIQVLVSLPLQVQVHGRQCWKLWVIPLVKFEF